MAATLIDDRPYPTWHGEPEDYEYLVECLQRNCLQDGHTTPGCPQMLSSCVMCHDILMNQEVLDNLAFVAADRLRIIRSEFMVQPKSADGDNDDDDGDVGTVE